MKPKANQPLSNAQKGKLSIMAYQAFHAARARGAVDDTVQLVDYRHAGQLEACKIESLRDVTQEHFKLIRGYWHTILGNVELAFDDFVQAGPDEEARRQVWYRLGNQVARLAEGMAAKHARQGVQVTPEQAAAESWKYAAAICADKYAGRRFRQLDAKELSQLGFTIFNRGSAMLDVGDPENRNKSQRNGTRQPTQGGGASFMQRARNRFAGPVQPGLVAPDAAR